MSAAKEERNVASWFAISPSYQCINRTYVLYYSTLELFVKFFWGADGRARGDPTFKEAGREEKWCAADADGADRGWDLSSAQGDAEGNIVK